MFIYFYNLLFPSVNQGSGRKQAVYSSGVTEHNEEVLHGSVDRVGGPQKKVPSELTTLPTPKPEEATRGAARPRGILKLKISPEVLVWDGEM